MQQEGHQSTAFWNGMAQDLQMHTMVRCHFCCAKWKSWLWFFNEFPKPSFTIEHYKHYASNSMSEKIMHRKHNIPHSSRNRYIVARYLDTDAYIWVTEGWTGFEQAHSLASLRWWLRRVQMPLRYDSSGLVKAKDSHWTKYDLEVNQSRLVLRHSTTMPMAQVSQLNGWLLCNCCVKVVRP